MLGQEGAFPNTPPKAGSITLSELDCKTCFQRSIVLVCFRSLHLRAGMEILDAAAQPQRPSPWSSLHTALKLLWSLEVTSLQKVRSLSTMHLSAHWPWFYAANHFVVEMVSFSVQSTLLKYQLQLTVEYLVELLHRLHPGSVPHWHSLSSWERPV